MQPQALSDEMLARDSEERVQLGNNGSRHAWTDEEKELMKGMVEALQPSEILSRKLTTSINTERPLAEGKPFEVKMSSMVHGDRTDKVFRVNPVFPAILSGEWSFWGIDEGYASMLKGMVEALQPEVILETGTNRGRSARAMAEGLKAVTGHGPAGMIYTIDMVDHEICSTGAITEDLVPFVTSIVGKTPECFMMEPLGSLKGIEFAFLDGDHTAAGIDEELSYVDAHRAEQCTVVIDNTRDDHWSELREFFKSYVDYPCVNLPTQTGTVIIQMDNR
jgi:hypothetical protein|tara:strand:+ start:2508 stop:3338 length:831 start_codon:yes stop_codon:yes gene_type:complete